MAGKMNKHLQELIKIANFDKEIDALEPKIAEKQQKLHGIFDAMSQKQDEILEIKSQILEISSKIKNANLIIDETQARIKTLAKKNSDVKNERELKSLSIEEELVNEQLAKANEDIEILEKDLQIKKEMMENLENAVSELKTAHADEEKNIESEIQKIRAEQKKLFAKKEALYAKLDTHLVSFYQKIRRWAKNTSVVQATNGACQGCFIRINDRVFASVKQGSEIVTCPHCGRILFLDKKSAI